MAAYQHASDYVPGMPPYSGVIMGGKWVPVAADSDDWQTYLTWAETEGNVPDPYLHPDQGGVAIVLEEGQVAYGVMLDSLPTDQGGNPAPGLRPKNVDVPQVMPGTANVGDELTCTMGNWEGEPKLYSSVWMSDEVNMIAAGTTYIVQPNDAGHSLTSVVTATNDYGAADAPPSNAIVIAATTAPAAAAAPEPTRSVPRQAEKEPEEHEGNHRRHRRE